MFDLKEFKRLAGERTKGKWRVKSDGNLMCYIDTEEEYIVPFPDKDSYPCRIENANAEFIAYVGTHADAIIQEIEKSKTFGEIWHEEAVFLQKEVRKLKERLEKLGAQNEILKKALEFYAEENNWDYKLNGEWVSYIDEVGYSIINEDSGETARKALSRSTANEKERGTGVPDGEEP